MANPREGPTTKVTTKTTTSFNVLYTKQKTKKRKAWQDGRIEVNLKTGSCVLYPSESSASTFCAPLDDPLLLTEKYMKQIESRQDLEIDFANYLVTIEYGSEASARGDAAPPPAKVLLPKFKAPAKLPEAVVPDAEQEPAAPQHHQPRHAPLASNQGRLAGGRGRYDVANEELDDLWGGADDGEGPGNRGSTDDDEDEGRNQMQPSWGEASRGSHTHPHEEAENDQYDREPQEDQPNGAGGFGMWGQGQGQGQENEYNGLGMGTSAGAGVGPAAPNKSLWNIDFLQHEENPLDAPPARLVSVPPPGNRPPGESGPVPVINAPSSVNGEDSPWRPAGTVVDEGLPTSQVTTAPASDVPPDEWGFF